MNSFEIKNEVYSKDCLDLLDIQYQINQLNSKIKIIGSSFQSLEQFLREKEKEKENNVNLGIKILIDINSQIKYFEKLKLSIPFFNFQNILVINRSKFLFINILPFPIKNNYIKIDITYNKNNEFLCSQLKENQSLPIYIHFKSIYYHIALLILKVIFNNYNLDNLKLINYTRLGWCLEKCLNKNIEERELIYF